MLPPLEQQGVADELEPRSKLEGRVVEHRLESVRTNIPCVADLVRVWVEVDVGLDEEDVVN
jgi:hypothetical protein